MHHILLMLMALGWWDGAASEGGGGGGPIEPDPVTPSGTGDRRRRRAPLFRGR